LEGSGQEKVPVSNLFFRDAHTSAVAGEGLEAVAAFVGEEEEGSGFEAADDEVVGDRPCHG